VKRFLSVAATAAAIFVGVVNARASEVKLLSSAAIKPALDVLAPQFERATKHKLVTNYVLTPEVPKLAESGGVFDVAIANPPHIDALVKSGKVVAGSNAQMARFGLGVGVRSGAPKPDVSTVDGLRKTLLTVKSVAFVGAGTTGPFIRAMMEQLGIAKEMKEKLRPGGIAENIAAVAKAEVEILIMPVPLILAGSGVDLASQLPSQHQEYIVLAAGLAAKAPEAKAGQALIQYLLSSDAEAALKAKGYERLK
jgi:molybdate transport system substrate-binding protein